DAGLDDFGWRISMATVATDGPFSSFPGIDRTLSILSGAGIQLDIAGRPRILMDSGSEPCLFPADLATSARLIDGPVTDLNVMTRRSLFRHRVERHKEACSIAPSSSLRLVLCDTGTITVRSGAQTSFLEPLDALFPDPDEPILVAGDGTFFIATIDRI